MRYYDSLGSAGYPISGGDTMEQSFQSHLDRGSAGGIDYAVGVGRPIYAPTKGRVFNRSTTGGGNTARFYHIDDNGAESGWYDEFLHLSAFGPDGAIFNPGDDIGARSGNTGTQTTGPHIHWHLCNAQGQRVRQWEYFNENPIKKKDTEMIIVNNGKDEFVLGQEYVHHVASLAEEAALVAVFGAVIWKGGEDFNNLLRGFGIPLDKAKAGKTWSRALETLQAVQAGGGGGGATPAQIAAAVDASLKDDFASIPKNVNDDVAKRMSS